MCKVPSLPTKDKFFCVEETEIITYPKMKEMVCTPAVWFTCLNFSLQQQHSCCYECHAK